MQLPQTQFFKGKNYRGFCPIGPWLTVLERDELPCMDELALELDDNGAAAERHHGQPGVQAGKNDHRALHLPERRSRKCPAYRGPQAAVH
ncbi:fumarylacetoacetate hydrolase family protein [Bradyrhizobium sp. NBAIM08]|nr:fumarylacetoacetate hydrolase family protein [Bradyrhizobium sp. NBAIM08]